MRRVLRVNLEGAGCRVIEIDGEELQWRARHEAVDALVLNLDARGRDVCEAVHALRRRVPGAVVAGYSILPPDDAVRRLCIDLYVEKPFDLALFVARLRSVCTRASLASVTGADLAL